HTREPHGTAAANPISLLPWTRPTPGTVSGLSSERRRGEDSLRTLGRSHLTTRPATFRSRTPRYRNVLGGGGRDRPGRHPVGVNRSLKPLQLETHALRLNLLSVQPVLDAPVNLLGEHHLARLGR